MTETAPGTGASGVADDSAVLVTDQGITDLLELCADEARLSLKERVLLALALHELSARRGACR